MVVNDFLLIIVEESADRGKRGDPSGHPWGAESAWEEENQDAGHAYLEKAYEEGHQEEEHQRVAALEMVSDQAEAGLVDIVYAAQQE